MEPEVVAAIITGIMGILGSVIAVLISRDRKKKMGSVRCDSCKQMKKDTVKNIRKYNPYYCARCRKNHRKRKNRGNSQRNTWANTPAKRVGSSRGGNRKKRPSNPSHIPPSGGW